MTAANQTLFNPTQLVLELKTTAMARAWQPSQNTGNSGSRWRSYLNRLVMETFLAWVQAEEDASATAGLDLGRQADLWSAIDGTTINISGSKLVLIPSEATDLSELRIPQEWVDIPELVADYYLAAEVNVDAGYVRVWGYTTHQKVKQASFDRRDRTYTLRDDELIADLDVLWLARELCPQEVTQAAVEPIAPIEAAQAQNLIERLGSQGQVLPRLAVPFSNWAALVQNPSWLKDLAARRRGESLKTPVVEWVKQGIDNLTRNWRQIEISTSVSGARGIAVQDNAAANDVPIFGLAKQIAIAQQPYELKILPLAETGAWRFELCCITPGCSIAPGLKLKLLTEDRQNFADNEDKAVDSVEQLFLEVDLDVGESLICQIKSAENVEHSETLQF